MFTQQICIYMCVCEHMYTCTCIHIGLTLDPSVMLLFIESDAPTPAEVLSIWIPWGGDSSISNSVFLAPFPPFHRIGCADAG